MMGWVGGTKGGMLGSIVYRVVLVQELEQRDQDILICSSPCTEVF